MNCTSGLRSYAAFCLPQWFETSGLGRVVCGSHHAAPPHERLTTSMICRRKNLSPRPRSRRQRLSHCSPSVPPPYLWAPPFCLLRACASSSQSCPSSPYGSSPSSPFYPFYPFSLSSLASQSAPFTHPHSEAPSPHTHPQIPNPKAPNLCPFFCPS